MPKMIKLNRVDPDVPDSEVKTRLANGWRLAEPVPMPEIEPAPAAEPPKPRRNKTSKDGEPDGVQ